VLCHTLSCAVVRYCVVSLYVVVCHCMRWCVTVCGGVSLYAVVRWFRVRVVLVEGNYLLLPDGDWAKLRDLFTETWWVLHFPLMHTPLSHCTGAWTMPFLFLLSSSQRPGGPYTLLPPHTPLTYSAGV